MLLLSITSQICHFKKCGADSCFYTPGAVESVRRAQTVCQGQLLQGGRGFGHSVTDSVWRGGGWNDRHVRHRKVNAVSLALEEEWIFFSPSPFTWLAPPARVKTPAGYRQAAAFLPPWLQVDLELPEAGSPQIGLKLKSFLFSFFSPLTPPSCLHHSQGLVTSWYEWPTFTVASHTKDPNDPTDDQGRLGHRSPFCTVSQLLGTLTELTGVSENHSSLRWFVFFVSSPRPA